MRAFPTVSQSAMTDEYLEQPWPRSVVLPPEYLNGHNFHTIKGDFFKVFWYLYRITLKGVFIERIRDLPKYSR